MGIITASHIAVSFQILNKVHNELHELADIHADPRLIELANMIAKELNDTYPGYIDLS